MPGLYSLPHPVSGVTVAPWGSSVQTCSGAGPDLRESAGLWSAAPVPALLPSGRAPCPARPPIDPIAPRYSRREAARLAPRTPGAAGRAEGRATLARLCSLRPRPPALPPGCRGGGAVGPVPGAGWRRVRLLGRDSGRPLLGALRGRPGARAQSHVPGHHRHFQASKSSREGQGW